LEEIKAGQRGKEVRVAETTAGGGKTEHLGRPALSTQAEKGLSWEAREEKEKKMKELGVKLKGKNWGVGVIQN
jgi:hypothetical protein